MVKNVFPLIFGRKGGEKFNLLNSLHVVTQNNISFVINKQNQVKNLKADLIDDLHSIIALENNLKGRNGLLNFKRNLFNDRSIEKYISIIKENDLFYEKFKEYSKKTKSYKKELEAYKKVFSEELLSSIEQLKNVVNIYSFKNGLLFSSSILSNEIGKTDFKYTSLNKKNKRLIISILKYLTRSTSKTTPFSSFNTVFCLEKNKKDLFIPINAPVKSSNFQITNLFFHSLKESLIQNENFKKHLKISCNTTIWEEQNNNNEFHFFINKNNNEAFKKLGKSPILNHIKEKLTNNDLTFENLIDEIIAVTDETRKTITPFVDSLIYEGFINVEYPVSCDNKDWIEELKNFILKKTLSFKGHDELILLLEDVQETIINLENTFNVNDRAKYIKESHLKILKYFNSKNNENNFVKKIKPQDLFYENTFSKFENTVSAKNFSTVSVKLKRVFSNLNNIPYKIAFKKFLANYLQEKYNGKLPILLFYEKVYLRYSHKFLLNEGDLNIFKKSFKRITTTVSENESLESIDLSKYIEKSKNDDIPFGAYIQVSDQDMNQIVINSFSNGNGSNISRFLNFLPKKYSELVLKYNRNKNVILTEVKDASIHNVNTYPPLSDYVISIADDNALKRHYSYINLSKVYVVSNSKEGLVLKDEKGMVIQPNNFSFEGLSRKSKFTQFLDIFNSGDILGYTLYKQNIRQLYENRLLKKNVVCIPRLLYGKNIVIQRKKWLIKKDIFLNLLEKPRLELHKIFININQWVQKNEIPDKVFIKIAQRDLSNSQNDNYKPQYIDFKSPIFLLLLLNMINKADDIIEITEIYPNVSQINQTGGYAKEYVLNIN